MPEEVAEKNRGGRPKGSRNRLTLLQEGLLCEADARALVESLKARAADGDVAAATALLARILPPLRAVAAPVTFDLPAGASLADQGRSVLAAVAAGELSPDVGERLLAALSALARIVETDELARRIAAMEGAINGKA